MLKSILLASTIFGLCLTHTPQHAEACGPKFGTGNIRAPSAQRTISQNPSRILIVGNKDKELIKQLRRARHHVESVDSVKDAHRSKYDLVIVEKDQVGAARNRFSQSRFVNKRSSDKATARMAERVLAQRVATTHSGREAKTTFKERTPNRVGVEGPATRNPTHSAVESSSQPISHQIETAPSAPQTLKEKTPLEETAKADSTLRWSRQFQFGTNKTNLSATAQQRLRTNAKWLEKHPGTSVLIEGHTNSVGETAHNLALSERRANAARSFLIGLGIESSRITVEAKGELEPGFSPSTSAQNRRIVLIKH